jgi:raffinose/stachyose/melibiose transport system permease protein
MRGGTAPVRPRRRSAHPLGRWARPAWIGLLIAPALAIMVAFVVVPLALALAYSFYSWNGVAEGDFIGLENFRTILFVEPYAGWTRRAFLHNTAVFVALMAIQNGTAFLIAFLLLKALPGHRVHRVILFLPVVLSNVVVGFVWKLFYNPIFGFVNQALIAVGLGSWASPWLGQPETAMGSILIAHAWHWVGFPALVFLAGMQRVPGETLEAARLDGAGDWVIMSRIIWPLIAPSVTIVFVLTFIGSFNWFELPYVMTGLEGSPGGATDVLGLYFYRTAFGNATSGLQDFGRGSALAVLIFLVIILFTTIMTRVLRRREIEV